MNRPRAKERGGFNRSFEPVPDRPKSVKKRRAAITQDIVKAKLTGNIPSVIRKIRQEMMGEYALEAAQLVIAIALGKGQFRQRISKKGYVIDSGAKPDLRFRAAELILGYAWGRPQQTVKVNGDKGNADLIAALTQIEVETGVGIINSSAPSGKRDGITAPAVLPATEEDE